MIGTILSSIPRSISESVKLTRQVSTYITKSLIYGTIYTLIILWAYTEVVPVIFIVLLMRVLGLLLIVLLFPLNLLGCADGLPMELLVAVENYIQRLDRLTRHFNKTITQILFLPILWGFLMILSAVDAIIIGATKYLLGPRKGHYTVKRYAEYFIMLISVLFSCVFSVLLLKYIVHLPRFSKLVLLIELYNNYHYLTAILIILFNIIVAISLRSQLGGFYEIVIHKEKGSKPYFSEYIISMLATLYTSSVLLWSSMASLVYSSISFCFRWVFSFIKRPFQKKVASSSAESPAPAI